MAQNRNGSEPLVVCGGKEQKGMQGMELWGKAIGVGEERLGKRSTMMIQIVSGCVFVL